MDDINSILRDEPNSGRGNQADSLNQTLMQDGTSKTDVPRLLLTPNFDPQA